MSEILYPSCSELVTRLDLVAIEDMRDALKAIVETSSYKVGITKSYYTMSKTPLNGYGFQERRFRFHEININDIDLIEDEDDNSKSIGIRLDKLSLEVKEKYTETYDVGYASIELVDPSNTTNRLYITIGDGCSGGDDLVFQCSDYDFNKFPMIKHIMDEFSSDYHAVDGGTTSGFEKWLNGGQFNDEE
jgi:hypothetical protein